MSESEKTSVAALISVILRRKINRAIDVKWLLKNQEYAREILTVSRELDLPDLNDYANHLERLIFGGNSPQAVSAPKFKASTDDTTPETDDLNPNGSGDEDSTVGLAPGKYVGKLR